MSLGSCNYALILVRPDAHQVVLSSRDDVLPVRTPAYAEEAAVIAPHATVELETVEVVYPKEAILIRYGYVSSVRRESERRDGPVTHRPAVHDREPVLGSTDVDGRVSELLVL